jgi:tripartite-type tricarboxylate transporter receptor subunit TctC
MMARSIPIALAMLIIAAAPVIAQDETQYYAGKRITILVNFAPGGPSDIEGRLLARHVGKHIPGNPTIIVQNMDGAGGQVGTNYLGEVAPRDGTMVGYLTGAAWLHVTLKDKARVNFLDYSVIAYQPGTTVYFARTDITPGLKVRADLAKAKGVVIGGLSADSSKDLLLRLTADMLGLNYKYVTGYKSNSAARLAFQRNEINLFAESPPGYRTSIEPSLVANNEAVPLFYNPGWDGVRYTEPSQVKGLDLPTFPEFYEEVHGKKPSGPLWKAYLHILATNGALQRMLAFPPQVPRAAATALQAGIRALEKDTEYSVAAQRLLGFVPDYEADEKTEETVRKALSIPAEDKEWIAAYVKKISK